MSLLEKIKQDQLQSRKDRAEGKTSLLTTLYSEAAMVGKNQNRETTDAEVISVIKKFMKNNEEFRKSIDKNEDTYFRLQLEYSILESYLPKQLTEQEIKDIVFHQDHETLGDCMKHFKENYSGLYDAKLVKDIYQTY